MLDFFPLPLAIAVLMSTALLLWRSHRGASTAQLARLAAWCCYLIAVIQITLFPMPVDGVTASNFDMDGVPFFSRVNMNPLAVSSFGDRQFFGNLLLCAPVGLLLPVSLSARLTRRRAVVICLLAPTCIELAQVLASAAVGFMYRATDIGDVLLNGVGAIAALPFGFALASALRARDLRSRQTPKGRPA